MSTYTTEPVEDKTYVVHVLGEQNGQEKDVSVAVADGWSAQHLLAAAKEAEEAGLELAPGTRFEFEETEGKEDMPVEHFLFTLDPFTGLPTLYDTSQYEVDEWQALGA